MANEVNFQLNTDEAKSKLLELLKLAQEFEGVASRLGGGIGGAPSTPGMPGSSKSGGVAGTASTTPPPITTTASAVAAGAAAATAPLTAPQQAIASQLYAAGLTPQQLGQAWQQAGLPGAPASPIAQTLQMTATSGRYEYRADPTLVMPAAAFAPFPQFVGPGNSSGPYSPGTGPNNLFDPNRTMAFDTGGYLASRAAATAQAYRQQSIRNAAIGYLGVNALTSGLDVYGQMTTTGMPDPMGVMGMLQGNLAGLAGGLAGAALSPGAPGAGFAVGALLGQQTGTATGRAMMAPFVRNRNMAIGLASVAAQMGVSPNDLVSGNGTSLLTTRGFRQEIIPGGQSLLSLAASISQEGKTPEQIAAIESGLYAGYDVIAGPQMAETYGTLASSALAAGRDPALALQPAINLARKFGLAAPAMARMAGEVIADTARFGGNRTDLLLAHGPEAYGAYADATGRPRLSSGELAAYRFAQGAGTAERIASLRTRGSGTALTATYDSEISNLLYLPGGRDSLAYAEAFAGRRDARRLQFEQETMTGYGVTASNLQAARGIAMSSPFAPGNRFGISLGIVSTNQEQMRRLQSYYRQRLASGELTEGEQLDLTQRYNALRVQNAQEIGALSEGVENRLPALAAGRVSGFQRFDAVQLAALQFYRAGSPVRAFGATGGRQARYQQDFLHSFDVGPIGPHSRLENLNPAAGYDSAVLRQILSVLERIAAQGRGRNGGGLPPIGGITRSGSDAPFN